jgi:hypothetical protein
MNKREFITAGLLAGAATGFTLNGKPKQSRSPQNLNISTTKFITVINISLKN